MPRYRIYPAAPFRGTLRRREAVNDSALLLCRIAAAHGADPEFCAMVRDGDPDFWSGEVDELIDARIEIQQGLLWVGGAL